jgi:hypothetical protein
MTHSALLIAGGALLTSVLAALIFRPTTSPEERHLRDLQRLMHALEAQRRVRDARRRREDRGRASRGASQPPANVEAHPAQEAEQEHVAQHSAEKRARRELEQERKAALKAEQARAKPQPPSAPDSVSDGADEPIRLSELPLYSWAIRIETEDRVPTNEN